MCGVCGIIDLQGCDNNLRPSIEKMCESMIHRGPDGDGIFVDGGIGLGMRRLSIIDIDSGWQPIYNETSDILVFQNGEIYNYQELRADLLGRGHVFKTESDTEVVAHLYEDYGDECINYLNGMFVVVIYDLKKKKLLIARDRVGIKPLFYSSKGRYFVYGSEVKTILASGLVGRDLNFEAVNDYFTFLYVVPPKTIFSDIQELPPGHIIICEEGVIEIKKYWELKYEKTDDCTDFEYCTQFLEIFRGAVKRQMISDVPLGAFLSGGIDSSAIVAIMSEFSNNPIKTFTIGYGPKEAYYDEREYARVIAKRYNTEHHEFVIDASILDSVESIVEAFDQPFGNSSVLPIYFISGKTRQHVTVALSGLGGDELFAGYERYVGIKIAGLYRNLPHFLRHNIIEKAVSFLSDSKSGSNFTQRLKRFVNYGKYPAEHMYYNLISCYDNNARNAFFSSEFISHIDINRPFQNFHDLFSHPTNLDDIERALFVDFHMYLPNDLLTMTDRMSMAHSLETRVPFLDFEIIDFAKRLPIGLKLKRYQKKYLFKESFKGLLPDSILHRQKKGFSVPLVLWFRDELANYMKEVFDHKKLDQIGLFSVEKIDAMLKLHVSGKENYFSQIWALFVFMKWHEKYVA